MSCGRKPIYTSVPEITDANILEVLGRAFSEHLNNRSEICTLRKYYHGDQPILYREKQVRPEINNRIVENHAVEIVSFKVGYVFASPIQLVKRGQCANHTEDNDTCIATLNEMLFEQGKAEKDVILGEDLAICGVGYRMVLPKLYGNDDLAPFDILPLVPENTFCVYSNDVYRRKVLGVTYFVDEYNNILRLGAYTATRYWEYETENNNFMGGRLRAQDNPLGLIPIVEYVNNSARTGSFETVLPLLNAINEETSDRLNSIEQFVQALLWFNNCEIDSEQFDELKERGGIVTKSKPGLPASVEYLTATLDQSGSQTFKEDLYQTVLTIAGVPDRRSSSGGNTGQAIMLASGWATAEAHARITEMIFSESERDMLRIVLKILKDSNRVPVEMAQISLSDIDIKFSRNKNDNLLTKTQGLINQLEAGIHPRIAIANCGLYSDPEQVYQDSVEFLDKWKALKETEANNQPSAINDGGEQSIEGISLQKV